MLLFSSSISSLTLGSTENKDFYYSTIMSFYHIRSREQAKLEQLFSRNKKLYALKEVKENALVLEGRSCRPETETTVNQYVFHDISV